MNYVKYTQHFLKILLLLLFDCVAKKKILLILTASHQFLNTAGQHHAGQGNTDWELTGVDSTQRDAYGKACYVVTLNGRAPFLPPLELTEMRNLLIDAGHCHRERKRWKPTLSKPFGTL